MKAVSAAAIMSAALQVLQMAQQTAITKEQSAAVESILAVS